MSKLYKYVGSIMLSAGLIAMPAAWSTDSLLTQAPFQLAQEGATEIGQEKSLDNVGRDREEASDAGARQGNTTIGGGSRELAPINEGAREENEGSPGNPNIHPDVDPKTIDRTDNDDPEEGFDGTMIGILLLIGLALGAMLLVANRRRHPSDAPHTRP